MTMISEYIHTDAFNGTVKKLSENNFDRRNSLWQHSTVW